MWSCDRTWPLSMATLEGWGSLLALASLTQAHLETGKPCRLSFQERPRARIRE